MNKNLNAFLFNEFSLFRTIFNRNRKNTEINKFRLCRDKKIKIY